MNKHLEKLDKELDDVLDVIIKSSKGIANYPKERREDARTIINFYGKLFQSESAVQTSKLIATKMAAENVKQARILLADFGLLTNEQVKLLEKSEKSVKQLK